MTTAANEEVSRLYGRYKSLVLATGAALVLETGTDELADEAEALLADAREAAATGVPQLVACAAAAGELHALLSEGGDVERVRATHKALRREVWKVIPCEYVPCGAAPHAHEHGGGNDG